MKVFIRTKEGRTIDFDPDDYPVAILLSDVDKYNVAHMSPQSVLYCAFPEHSDSMEVAKWLKELRKSEGL